MNNDCDEMLFRYRAVLCVYADNRWWKERESECMVAALVVGYVGLESVAVCLHQWFGLYDGSHRIFGNAYRKVHDHTM